MRHLTWPSGLREHRSEPLPLDLLTTERAGWSLR